MNYAIRQRSRYGETSSTILQMSSHWMSSTINALEITGSSSLYCSPFMVHRLRRWRNYELEAMYTEGGKLRLSRRDHHEQNETTP